MARISKLDVNEAAANLRAVGMDLDIEGAEYWSVENPFGPTGLHLVERRPDDAHSVSQNTALGTYRWSGPKEAHAAVTAMYRALLAARNAQTSGDATSRRTDELAVNP
jgi:hypothetical protein